MGVPQSIWGEGPEEREADRSLNSPLPGQRVDRKAPHQVTRGSRERGRRDRCTPRSLTLAKFRNYLPGSETRGWLSQLCKVRPLLAAILFDLPLCPLLPIPTPNPMRLGVQEANVFQRISGGWSHTLGSFFKTGTESKMGLGVSATNSH